MTVWAVIAHYGDVAVTTRAAAALLAGSIRPEVVLVVDNSGNVPAAGISGAEVMRPGGNIGFAGAARAGALRAVAAGAEWVWLFNNDAVADEGCLAALLAAGAAAPDAALLSPVIALRGRPGLWYAGGDVRPGGLSVRHRTRAHGDAPYETGFVTGCAVLARARFVRDCGAPDESLFMYYEDVDWSLRASAAGWKLLVVPAARVGHDVDFVNDRRHFSSPAVYYMVRNRVLLARRWGSVLLALPAACSWGGRQVLKGRGWRAVSTAALAVAAGLTHGVAGRRGPAPPALLGRLR